MTLKECFKNLALEFTLASGLLCALTLTFTACDNSVSQQAQGPQCAGGATPTNIQAEPQYVVETCPVGAPIIVRVSDYNSTYGANYSGGQDMLHDPFFWAYLMGPHYSSYPIYHSYTTMPGYGYYHPSPYVLGNLRSIRTYGLRAGYFKYISRSFTVTHVHYHYHFHVSGHR